jgi:tRNA threonylcarbamoyladenosine biosynthesis protein TsaB
MMQGTPPRPGLRLLAIETSTRAGSVAGARTEDGNLPQIYQRVLAPGVGTAQALAPAIADLCAELAWTPPSLNVIAVAVGPGSFTGLRVGVTTAKVLAYAVGASVIGVNTLEVLASQVEPSATPLWAIMDAQRDELFAARFLPGQSAWQCEVPTHVIAIDAWIADLNGTEFVTGPVLSRIVSKLPSTIQVVDALQWQPTAAAVAQLAWRDYQRGRRDDIWRLAPDYYRKSAAEERATAAACDLAKDRKVATQQ